jgi:hypothetical protein
MRQQYQLKRNWNCEHSPPMITVEPATAAWRVIVFEKTKPDYWAVAEILECDDPGYWVRRMGLPENTVLHQSIAAYETGRARKLSSRIDRIVQQKQKETA